MAGYPILFRKRYIPEECVRLKDDEILSWDGKLLVTRWRVLRPRTDIDRGASAYWLDEGVKVSRVLDKKGNLVYHYCDIFEPEWDGEKLICRDLLADVIVSPDGVIQVKDLDELGEALGRGLIPQDLAVKALKRTGWLLDEIGAGRFGKWRELADKVDLSKL